MNDQKNLMLALVLTGVVLLAWQFLFGVPQMQQKQAPPPQQQQAQQQPPVSSEPGAPPQPTPGAPPPLPSRSVAGPSPAGQVQLFSVAFDVWVATAPEWRLGIIGGVAVIGLKQTYTGNTICDEDAPIALESIVFPKPVISASLLPSRTIDTGKLSEALGRLVRDDPTLKAHTDEETKDLILSGMGELHLEVSVEKLKRAMNTQDGVQLGRPRVAYRQTLAKPLEMETRYIKQTGGRGKFAVIWMKYQPPSASSGKNAAKLICWSEEAWLPSSMTTSSEAGSTASATMRRSSGCDASARTPAFAPPVRRPSTANL